MRPRTDDPLKSDVMARLARWIASPEGKRHVDEMERRGNERAAEIEERHKLVAAMAEARRVKREDIPPLRPRIEELHTEWRQAVRAAEAARHRWADVRGRGTILGLDANSTIDRSENLLRQSADPRIQELAERLRVACVNWGHTWERLAQRETVGMFMEAYTRILNAEELGEMKRALDAATDAIDRLSLVAEPEEDEILRVVAVAEAALSATLGGTRSSTHSGAVATAGAV